MKKKVRILKNTLKDGRITYDVQMGNFWLGWSNCVTVTESKEPYHFSTIEKAREWKTKTDNQIVVSKKVVK